jgi:hypothetical protein
MIRTLPDETSAVFLLLEDFRQEVGNKLSFMGIFPNADIVLPKDADRVVLASLAFALIARGGEGTIKTKATVVTPAGDILLDSPIGEVMLEKAKTHYAMLKLVAVELIAGTYTVKFFFDDTVIERTFEVKRAEILST